MKYIQQCNTWDHNSERCCAHDHMVNFRWWSQIATVWPFLPSPSKDGSSHLCQCLHVDDVHKSQRFDLASLPPLHPHAAHAHRGQNPPVPHLMITIRWWYYYDKYNDDMMVKCCCSSFHKFWLELIKLDDDYDNFQLNPVLGRAMVKGITMHFDVLFIHFDKLIRPHPGPLWEGGKGSYGKCP